jgi:hypothetical protein
LPTCHPLERLSNQIRADTRVMLVPLPVLEERKEAVDSDARVAVRLLAEA